MPDVNRRSAPEPSPDGSIGKRRRLVASHKIMVITRSSRSKLSPPAAALRPTTISPQATPRRLSQSNQGKPRPAHGLPLHLKKQLIVDIEEAGGFAKFASPIQDKAIARILDQRPHLFSDGLVRKQARNYIQYCRQLADKGQYYERVLHPLRITKSVVARSSSSPHSSSQSSASSEEERKAERDTATTSAIKNRKVGHQHDQQEQEELDDDESATSSSSSSLQAAALVNSFSGFQIASPQRRESRPYHQSPPTERGYSSSNQIMSSSSLPQGLPCIKETIQVDVENPFNNGRVAVFPLMGIKGTNGVDEHQGYAIALPFDKRPLLIDKETVKVQARITFKNEVVITGLPAEVGFCGLLYHGANAASAIWENSSAWEDEDCEWIRDGITHGVNNFLSDETRFFTRTREIHLIFPKSVELNVACFKTQGNISDKGWSETLPLRNIYLSNEPRDGHERDANDQIKDKTLEGSTPHIFFIVAREDTKSYKRMKAAKKPGNFADNFL